ncbi:pyridoxamine 5'-phosphate oxidase family protein [Porphyrobacter sp. GA68]|uniref:pyridoxamine 5'-phosphate oxidase family protein n=1 Tax=Porphyrobacter sp. GA68 TaxID=2883480 RepID=UPI001D1979E7|nr:pyridoxamine 5'-phosphate oxidase family protein [Porphyrobacter sp. GA68]
MNAISATESLPAVRLDIWARLDTAVRDRRSAMHTPVIATADADARVMVLREFDVASVTLRFHLDARSPKRSVIADDPRVGVLAYDKGAGVQIRCRGRAEVVVTGERVDAAWAGSAAFARRCYLGAAPGELCEGPASGLPAWIEGQQPTEDQLRPARANFAIMLVELEEIDWYSLAHTGHRRAVFRRADGWAGQWLTP